VFGADLTIENQTDGDLLKNLALMLQQRDGAPVEHVQTHISHILLTPGHAYKLKRPVRLALYRFQQRGRAPPLL
jgi:aminoglycoside phosphotransferase family enzyme